MALIKCPECGKEVSDLAASCPNCSYPIAQKNDGKNKAAKKKKSYKWLGSQMLGSMMVVFGLLFLATSGTESSGIWSALLSFSFLLFGVLFIFAGKISERWLKK